MNSLRYRATSEQMVAPRSRLDTQSYDQCSSPDSAVATGSESLGSSDSISSLDVARVKVPSAKPNGSSVRQRNNRRFRRRCQTAQSSLDSCLSTNSADLTSSAVIESKTSTGGGTKLTSPVPKVVVRNTLTCPLVFRLEGCRHHSESSTVFDPNLCPLYPPPLSCCFPSTWISYCLPDGNGWFPSSSQGNVLIDLTGQDISIEHLTPCDWALSSSSKRAVNIARRELDLGVMRNHVERKDMGNTNMYYHWHLPLPLPMYIVSPHLSQGRLDSKAYAAPHATEFLRYTQSSPPHRQWRLSGTTPSTDGYRITLMCYNVLSSNYATQSQYPYCPTWAIDWEYRRRAILNELRHYSPSIICLQEIDTDQFQSVFVPELAKNNYEGVFLAKSRCRTMDPVSARKVDGCAIFWLTERFTQVTKFRHEFMISCSNVSEQPSALLVNRVMTRDNVAIGVVLETKSSLEGSGGRRFCVSTGHIHWDPENSDVKLIQTIMWTTELWNHLDQFTGKDTTNSGGSSGAARMPVILCGDLNSLPTSGVVEFLSRGCIPMSHEEFLNHGFNYQFEKWRSLEKWATEGHILRHRFNFDRAYRDGAVDGMTMTNMTYEFKGMIDYIFFTRQHFRLLGSLDQIPDSWFMEERVLGCPHVQIPSDHFSLLVELDLLAQSTHGRVVSDRGDAQSADNSSSTASNSPKPKAAASAVSRPKPGKR